jgi:hypothetical protein
VFVKEEDDNGELAMLEMGSPREGDDDDAGASGPAQELEKPDGGSGLAPAQTQAVLPQSRPRRLSRFFRSRLCS